MCGRFTEHTLAADVARLFDVAVLFPLEARYNVAPTQMVPVVRVGTEGRELVRMKWGLVPAWADDPSIGNRMINARSETIAAKPAFRSALRSRRCLVPADGFYEWQRLPGGGKQPYLIRLAGGKPFAFAGLWERWTKAGEPLETFTILTTECNEVIRPLHDRMPVIVDSADYALWLDPAMHDPERLQPLLRPYDGPDELELLPVSTRVNSPRNDDPACAEPLR